MKKALRVFALAGALALSLFSGQASANPPYCANLNNTPCSTPGAQQSCQGYFGEPGGCFCGQTGLKWKCLVYRVVG
jgi:hypothetical protein